MRKRKADDNLHLFFIPSTYTLSASTPVTILGAFSMTNVSSSDVVLGGFSLNFSNAALPLISESDPGGKVVLADHDGITGDGGDGGGS